MKSKGSNLSAKLVAYGGVLFDAEGRILLRRPAGGYGGDRWTFPKGTHNPSDDPKATALREVLEETGYNAAIICDVQGSFEGDVSVTEYFVMRPVGNPGPFDFETEETRWVTRTEAFDLLGDEANRKRKRDLTVLAAAITAFDAHVKSETHL